MTTCSGGTPMAFSSSLTHSLSKPQNGQVVKFEEVFSTPDQQQREARARALLRGRPAVVQRPFSTWTIPPPFLLLRERKRESTLPAVHELSTFLRGDAPSAGAGARKRREACRGSRGKMWQ